MTGRGFARRVTLATLDLFSPLLKPVRAVSAAIDEPTGVVDLDEANVEMHDDPDLAAAEALFSGVAIRVANPFHRARPRRTPNAARAPSTRGTVQAPARGQQAVARDPVAIPTRGPLIWARSGLPASSAQRQRGHPTGGVRLVQARFTDASGRLIDKTTYFRDTAFARLQWTVGQQSPFREDAEGLFEVLLLGRSYGEHLLKISHKPSGEADQGNYTTMLHWGDLGETVRELNLTGRTIRLFAPPPGQDAPFTLEVS